VQRFDLMLRPDQETLTVRNNANQAALPVRQWGSFRPGTGVGGAGVHWTGISWRFDTNYFRLRSHYTERYGANAIPDYMTITDLPLTYEELEPFYDRYEYLAGISGKAGNLKGAIQAGGNPFEAPRARDYPCPPLDMPYAGAVFGEAAQSLGYHPFPIPSANVSRAYTNPIGVTMGPCTFCGYCSYFGCANYSKSSAQTTVLPVLMRKGNFEARTESEVLKIQLDRSGKRASGVIYVDSSGQEWEQPAELVIVTAFPIHNARMLMLSGIGQIYDPRSGEGQVGRNFAYQIASSVQVFFDNQNFNPFMGAGASGMGIDDFNNDNFDHGGLGFLGGASIRLTGPSGTPISNRAVPPGTPRWGAAWKKATAENYASNLDITVEGANYSSRQNHLDLDPTYKDRFGRPLLRMTFDFTENDMKMAAYTTDRGAQIAHAMKGARQVVPAPRTGPYSVVPYQTTHLVGGTIMGNTPKDSVLNRYLQSWDVPNVFVIGASAYPQNPGHNPTGTVGALAFWSAHAIIDQYLKNPGPLVQA
jgi:gluconate 2-dehydrogenase alpha chain